MRTPSTIVFHEILAVEFDFWAEYQRLTAEALRAETIQALTDRLHEATLHHLLRPNPPIFRLKYLRSAILFTIEPHAIVVRGYDRPKGVSKDVCDVHYYCDAAWGGYGPGSG